LVFTKTCVLDGNLKAQKLNKSTASLLYHVSSPRLSNGNKTGNTILRRVLVTVVVVRKKVFLAPHWNTRETGYNM
jgi:hypothetical protein